LSPNCGRLKLLEVIDDDHARLRGFDGEFVKIDGCRFRWIDGSTGVAQLGFSRLSNEYRFDTFGGLRTLVWSSLRKGALCAGHVFGPKQLDPNLTLKTCAEHIWMQVSSASLNPQEELRRLVRAFEFISSESCLLGALPF
jgi:hypothetical protein